MLQNVSVFIIFAILHSSRTEPMKEALYDGDVILIGGFPVHRRGDDARTCGSINMDDGLPLMEAMFYTLDEINGSGILPFVLGAIGVDTCDNPSYTLSQCVKFLRYLVMKESTSDNNEMTKLATAGVVDYRKLVGMVGAYSSDVSGQAASLLQLFNIPQVSYASTCPDLSDKNKYPYFLRTVPSDRSQARAVAEILRYFEWSYVALAYEDSVYGVRGSEQLMESVVYQSVCLAGRFRVRLQAADSYYRDVIVKLRDLHVRVVILYMNSECARSLFMAARQLALEKRFIWIGTDGWSGRLYPVLGLETIAAHALTLTPDSGYVAGFGSYFKRVMEEHDMTKNPWWDEFINATLTSNRSLSEANEHIGHVRDAVYAYAYALRDYYAVWCQDKVLPCKMEAADIDGQLLRDFLRNVSFQGSHGHEFIFINGSDAQPRYKLMTYDVDKNGTFTWKEIGYYEGDDTVANISLKLTFANKSTEESYRRITSVCSAPCAMGQAKMALELHKCCWVCTNCTEYEFLEREDKCSDCPLGSLPSANRSLCLPITASATPWDSAPMVAIVTLATVCLLVTMATSLILFLHRSTPTVRAIGRESSTVILCGIVSLFINTFLFFIDASLISCSITRFSLGLSYTLCYAAILTKTVRVARIFDPDSRTERMKHVSPRSQLITICLLVGVEVTVVVVWVIISRPVAILVHPDRNSAYWICTGTMDLSYLIPLVYPFVLLLISTVYAFKTRKTPAGFNETRLLTFTNYTNCVVWLAFVPVFFAYDIPYIRMLTLAMATSIGGAVTLGCFFLTRVYVVLCRPEKNTKEAVMQPSSSSSSGNKDYIRKTSNTSGMIVMNVPQGTGVDNGGLCHIADNWAE